MDPYQLIKDKKAHLAKKIFLEKNDFAKAAYCALLEGDLEQARNLYILSNITNAKKWGLFLCKFLTNPSTIPVASPGFLTFRLFFEETLLDFLRYGHSQYVEYFKQQEKILSDFYPDFGKEYQKAMDIFESQSNSLENAD